MPPIAPSARELPRLLVVDDQPFVLDLLRRYLGRLGYRVDCASEPGAAADLLAARDYRLMIADLGLDAGDPASGLGLIELARRRSPGVRVVVLTGGGDSAAEEESLRRGADALLLKPQPLPRIAAVVGELLGA